MASSLSADPDARPDYRAGGSRGQAPTREAGGVPAPVQDGSLRMRAEKRWRHPPCRPGLGAVTRLLRRWHRVGRSACREGLQRAARAFAARHWLPCAISPDLQVELSLRWAGLGDRGRQAAVQGQQYRVAILDHGRFEDFCVHTDNRGESAPALGGHPRRLGDGVLVSAQSAAPVLSDPVGAGKLRPVGHLSNATVVPLGRSRGRPG